MKIFFLIAVLFSLACGNAQAEQVLESGDYRLHYIAMVSSELSPEVAQAYGIRRSRNIGIVVLNLQHVATPLLSQSAQVSGRIRNLIGQERLEELRMIEEQDARYWIASFDFSHLETMRFEFSVDPEGSAPPFVLKFSQQFYTPGR